MSRLLPSMRSPHFGETPTESWHRACPVDARHANLCSSSIVSSLLHRLRSAAGAGLLAIAVAGCGHVPAAPDPARPQDRRPGIRRHDHRLHRGARRGGQSGRRSVERRRDLPGEARAHQGARRRRINYAQYVFEEGQPADDVARALAERCRAGVQVNVLVDAVGALAMPAEHRQTHDGRRVPRRDVPAAPARSRSTASTTAIIAASSSSDGQDRHHGGVRHERQVERQRPRRRANGATPTSGSRARSSSSSRAPSPRTGSRRRASRSAATTTSPRPDARGREHWRRPCGAPPRAAASRCTRCSCSPWRRRAVDPHHQPVLRARRQDDRDARAGGAAGRARRAHPARARSTTTSSARRAAASWAGSSARASRSTSTGPRCSTPRRW